MNAETALKELSRLVGTWTTEATHPALPGVVVHGTVAVEWLEGERFLIHRGRTDHRDFPDSISVIGITDRDRVDPHGEPSVPPGSRLASLGSVNRREQSLLSMHYFDSRGVFRIYEVSVDDQAWRWWRNAPGFSQRFAGAFADGGDTIRGTSQVCQDDVHWNDDLQITYRRRV